MERLHRICDQIEDELDLAEDYVEEAYLYAKSDKNSQALDSYIQLTEQTLEHINMLQGLIHKHVEKVKSEKGENFDIGMTHIHKFMCKRHLEDVAEIRNKLQMTKNIR